MFLRGPAAASVAAKTGTLGYARALSGYVTAKDGTPLAFAIMINHHTIGGSQANRAIEAIVHELAEFSYDQ
jgi:D-alanyl-D-alanine carboxypeptidase/D-alanyl-D-alanine-endopeptidase (penicillin-binding protein 4)